MNRSRAQGFIELWRALDAVEQDAIHDLLVHRLECPEWRGENPVPAPHNGGTT